MTHYSGRRGSSRLLAGDAKQGLKAKIETHWALSGRGAEFWWIRESSSELSAADAVFARLWVFAEQVKSCTPALLRDRLRCAGFVTAYTGLQLEALSLF
jgi:hypothetical protein